MPAVTYNTDTIVHVIHSTATTDVGTASPYVSKDTHPGTTKNIEGWKWNQRTWPSLEEFLSTAYVPTLWEPDLTGIPTAWWQSGIGDNNDLLMVDIQNYYASGLPVVWAPHVYHGWYYIYNQEWYLYSDQYQTQYFQTSATISGQQYVDMKYFPRPTIPIQVRQYLFNRTTGKYEVSTEFRRKVEFTESGTDPEFTVDYDYIPPRVWINQEFTEAVGSGVTVISGVADPAEVSALEFLGVSNGQPAQEFRTIYLPIDATQPIQVLSYVTAANPTEWEVISGVDEWTVSGYQVLVDPALGTFLFGTHDPISQQGEGIIPNQGDRIVVHYTKALEVTYEPLDISRDVAIAVEGDTNPLTTAKHVGFVQIATNLADEAASITLYAEDLPFFPPNTYDIAMGNTVGELIAKVETKSGEPVEGQEVTFEILDPQVGDFGGGATTVTAITDGYGEAHVFYHTPVTISDAGSVTDDVTISGGYTIMDVEGLGIPASLSGLYTFMVHKVDDVLGILEGGDLTNYYNTFFSDEDIVGTTATELWEGNYRDLHGLNKPITYVAGDLRTGAKTILLTTRTIMNPHTGDFEPSGLGTLHPISAEDVGTTEAPIARLTFDTILPDPAGVNNTKSYLIVGESQTPVQASMRVERTGQRIYSNIIQLAISVPDSMNGNFYAEELSDIPSGLMLTATNVELVSDSWIIATSGLYEDEWMRDRLSGESYVDWFRRTQRGATTVLGLVSVTPSGAPVEIPLGFRLQSAGITVASILDAVTFIDANDTIPSGFFTPSGWYNILI